MSEELRLEVAERVAVVTIDRPEARNAIGLATIASLEAVLGELEAMDISVVVLTGAGDRAFVSGGDLKELERVRPALPGRGSPQRACPRGRGGGGRGGRRPHRG